MESVPGKISLALSQMSGWELAAVILAIAYLILIMRENIWGWYCALISTAIYTVVFWKVSLMMDSALNIYYMGMAVYGWYQWRGKMDIGRVSTIVTWRPSLHLYGLLIIIVGTLASGYLLAKNTQAAWPYLDSFTTWASVFTTYMVAKKVLENWLYWILIDTVALYLYIDRGLYLTALLFFAYLIICVLGYLGWKKKFHNNQHATA